MGLILLSTVVEPESSLGGVGGVLFCLFVFYISQMIAIKIFIIVMIRFKLEFENCQISC